MYDNHHRNIFFIPKKKSHSFHIQMLVDISHHIPPLILDSWEFLVYNKNIFLWMNEKARVEKCWKESDTDRDIEIFSSLFLCFVKIKLLGCEFCFLAYFSWKFIFKLLNCFISQWPLGEWDEKSMIFGKYLEFWDIILII